MTKLGRWILIVALLLVAIAAAWLLFEMGLLAQGVRRQAEVIAADLHGELVTATQATANLRDAAAAARDASNQAALAAAEQRAYWNKTSLETYKTMASLRLTITRTDKSLNDVLVPRLSQNLDAAAALESSAAANLTDATRHVNAVIDDLQPGIAGMNSAAQAAATAMSDPAIHETLAHVDGTAGNLDATSSDIHAFVHRETTPVRGTWNVIKAFLQSFAGPAAQVATAAK